MNFASTSSSQAGFTKIPVTKGLNDSSDATLKTFNPQIFPSLHPLSGIYRQQKKNANLSSTGRLELQEPIKKVKCEKGARAVVLKANNIEYGSNEKTIQIAFEKEVFRVPQLPKRLRNKNVQSQEQKWQTSVTERLQGFQSVGESFTTSDYVAQFQTPLSSSNLETKLISNCQSQNAEWNPLLLNALYERLKLEYYNFQLQQNLFTNYQEKLYQNTQNAAQRPYMAF